MKPRRLTRVSPVRLSTQSKLTVTANACSWISPVSRRLVRRVISTPSIEPLSVVAALADSTTRHGVARRISVMIASVSRTSSPLE